MLLVQMIFLSFLPPHLKISMFYLSKSINNLSQIKQCQFHVD
jgi:hypothetical protein